MPAESDSARTFTELCGRIHAGTASASERAEVRRRLELWAGNDALLKPQLVTSDLTAELAEISRNVSRAATMGLAALDRGAAPNATGAQEQVSDLQAMEKLGPTSLRNMVVPGVLLLVQSR